jgi:hypothetical protein
MRKWGTTRCSNLPGFHGALLPDVARSLDLASGLAPSPPGHFRGRENVARLIRFDLGIGERQVLAAPGVPTSSYFDRGLTAGSIAELGLDC